MKPWKCAVMALLLGVESSFLTPAPPVEAASSLFTVCGEATDGKKDTAVRDAQKKAVRKVLVQLMTEDNPQFATLLANYRSYAAEPQVFNKKSQGGKLLLFSKVPVDVDAIKEAISSANEAKQDRHSDQTAYFLVRVTGLPANGDDAKGQAQVVKTYNDTFSRLGFETGTLDAVFNALAPYRETPYDTFYQQMVQRVETDPDFLSVTMAVVGELAVTDKAHDANGFTREVSVRVDAYDVLAKKRIASYSDVYQLWNKDPKLADQMLLDKAAVNSARAIADQTSTYWQKH
ncbi:MAG: hypothetical protein SPL39_11660 [Selenomonadaceae bacterium]|nr:hypothetical protein [Selenomonadaceae bacterium]